MTMFILYLLFVVAPGLDALCGFLGFAFFTGTTVCAVFYHVRRAESGDADHVLVLRGVLRWAIPLTAVFWIATVAMPDKKQMYLLIGGWGLLEAAQNEEVQKLPNNVLRATNKFLEEIGAEQEN